MKELWTPWRMPYIVASRKPEGCIFCTKPRESGSDSLILSRGPRTFTILNLYPYTVGHLMVIPYRHLSRSAEMTEAERNDLAAELARAERILRRVAGTREFHAGINLGRAAGAGVEGHLHAHLVPADVPAWGPPSSAEGEALAIPLEITYERLVPHFQSAVS